jgi:chaperonin GroEL
MPAREITFGDDMTEGLLRGVRKVADVVRLTLGPPSRAVLMQTAAKPEMVGNGSAIARGIDLKDPTEQMGAMLLRSVADAIEKETGDGCTTAIVLADALLREGVRALAQGGNRTKLLNEIDRMVALTVEEVSSFSETADEKMLRGVALTAANGDIEVGAIVAEAVLEFTPEGLIVIEEGQRPGVEREVLSGFRIESGYISHYFTTDAERREAVLEGPRIAVTTGKLSAFADVAPLMEWAAKTGSPLLVIAENVEGELLTTMVTNKLKGVLKIAAVRLPMNSPAGRAMAEDIATVTGTVLLAHERGESLAQASVDQLGRCKRAVLTDKDTMILEGVAQPEVIETAIRRLTNAAKGDRGADRDALYQRMGRLRGRALVLRVGAPTESEVKPKLMLVERTLRAVRNAAKDGVVVGGGVALLRAASTLRWAATSTEAQLAARVVTLACEAPMRQIVYNAGYEPAVVIGRVRESRSATLGFNALTGRYEDLLASMVVDASNVLCAGLRTAASVAVSVLRAGVSVREAVPPPRLTEFERKYAKQGGYIATQSLALPEEMAGDDDSLLAYALLRGADEAGPLVAERTYVLETGLTRVRKTQTGAGSEREERSLELYVLVAAYSARCHPSRVQLLTVPAGEQCGSVEFAIVPLEAGGRTVEVEFFYERVLAARITLAFDVAAGAQV